MSVHAVLGVIVLSVCNVSVLHSDVVITLKIFLWLIITFHDVGLKRHDFVMSSDIIEHALLYNSAMEH